MPNPYLVNVLPFGPEVMSRLLDKLPAEALDKKPDPNRFSIREVIAHMADWEPILLVRLKQAVEQPGSTLIAYDEAEMAVKGGYSTSDPKEQIRLLIERRKATVEFLKTLSDEDWDKSVLHPERGTLTAREQAFTIIGHDMYHIEQMTAVE